MPTGMSLRSVEGDGSTVPPSPDSDKLQTMIACSSSEAKCVVVALLSRTGLKDSTTLNDTISEIINAGDAPLEYVFSSAYLPETCKQLVRCKMAIQQPGSKTNNIPHSYELNRQGIAELAPFVGNLLGRIALTHTASFYELWGSPRLQQGNECAGTVGRICILRQILDQPLRLGRGVSSRVTVDGADKIARQDMVRSLRTHPFTTDTDGVLQIKPEYAQIILDLAALLEETQRPSDQFIKAGRDSLEELLKSPDDVIELLNRTFRYSRKKLGAKAVYSELMPPIYQLLGEHSNVISADQLTDLLPGLFPSLEPEQLKRLGSQIIKGKIAGIKPVDEPKGVLLVRRPDHLQKSY